MSSVLGRYPAVQDSGLGVAAKPIGVLLVGAGRLTPKDTEAVLQYQREHPIPFGEAAVRLGLISEADVLEMLARQFDYPYLRPGESGVQQEIVTAYDPYCEQSERLRALRGQLMLRGPQAARTEARLLVVASVARGDGRSYLAANLAVVFSQLGQRTLLIDADLRNPHQHTLFGLERGEGLSTYLSGRSGLDSVQEIAGLPQLSVLTAGPVPPNPQELLLRSSLSALLAGLRREYDVVVIDTSAAEVAADAVALSARGPQAVLVARRNRTQVVRLHALGQEIAAAGAQVVGCVLNPH